MRMTGAEMPPAGAWGKHALPGLSAATLVVMASGGVLMALADWPVVRLLSGFLAFVLMGAVVAYRAGWLAVGAEPGPANLVTLLRAGLVCLIGTSILAERPEITWSLTALVAVALALDAVDGWLARRLNTVSDFGARFDMEVDALLLMVLSLLCWQTGRVGAWVLLIGLMRYAFVAVGRLWPRLRRSLPERRRRKAVCALQGIALGLALAPPIGPLLASAAAVVALAALTASFALDLLWLGRATAADRARSLIGAPPAPYSVEAAPPLHVEERG
jgi:phosphatidylglycerophosphate synthase